MHWRKESSSDRNQIPCRGDDVPLVVLGPVNLLRSFQILKLHDLIRIRCQRTDLNFKLLSHTDLGTSRSGKAMYLSVGDVKNGAGPGGGRPTLVPRSAG